MVFRRLKHTVGCDKVRDHASNTGTDCTCRQLVDCRWTMIEWYLNLQEADKKCCIDSYFAPNAHLELPDLMGINSISIYPEMASPTIGIGMAMMIRSVVISVAVKTVSMFNVFEHCVKKIPIGAQLRSQCSPH